MAGLPPGDPQLVSMIVNHLKTQGLFDQFRRDCLADVDTKPAYLNLKQRVDNFVSNHLSNHTWSPHLNKNQLRNNIRQLVLQSGMLEQGVDRIVAQVVDPKINHTFRPQVERVVREFLSPGSYSDEPPLPVPYADVKPESSALEQVPLAAPPTTTASDAMSILDTITSLNQGASSWAGPSGEKGRKGPTSEEPMQPGEKGEHDVVLAEEGDHRQDGQTMDEAEEAKLALEIQAVDIKTEDSQVEFSKEEGEAGEVKTKEEETDGEEGEKAGGQDQADEEKDKAGGRTGKSAAEKQDDDDSLKSPNQIRQKARERLKEEYSLEDSDLEGLSDITVSSVHTSDLSSFEEDSDEEQPLSESSEEGELPSDGEDKEASADKEEDDKEQKPRRKAYVHKPFLYSRYYSDSDDEVTVEERRRCAAKDKEDRLLKRQQNRERMEERRKQKAAQAELQGAVRSTGTFPSCSARSDSPSAEEPQAKQARKERKVLEKKMALNRKRKLDSRCVSKTELKSTALKTLQPKSIRKESHSLDERSRRHSGSVSEDSSEPKKISEKSRTHSFILELEQGSQDVLKHRPGGKFDRHSRKDSVSKERKEKDRSVSDERAKPKQKPEKSRAESQTGEASQKEAPAAKTTFSEEKGEKKAKVKVEKKTSGAVREGRGSVLEGVTDEGTSKDPSSSKKGKASSTDSPKAEKDKEGEKERGREKVREKEKPKGEKNSTKSENSKVSLTPDTSSASRAERGEVEADGAKKKEKPPKELLRRSKSCSEDRQGEKPKVKTECKDGEREKTTKVDAEGQKSSKSGSEADKDPRRSKVTEKGKVPEKTSKLKVREDVKSLSSSKSEKKAPAEVKGKAVTPVGKHDAAAKEKMKDCIAKDDRHTPEDPLQEKPEETRRTAKRKSEKGDKIPDKKDNDGSETKKKTTKGYQGDDKLEKAVASSLPSAVVEAEETPAKKPALLQDASTDSDPAVATATPPTTTATASPSDDTYDALSDITPEPDEGETEARLRDLEGQPGVAPSVADPLLTLMDICTSADAMLTRDPPQAPVVADAEEADMKMMTEAALTLLSMDPESTVSACVLPPPPPPSQTTEDLVPPEGAPAAGDAGEGGKDLADDAPPVAGVKPETAEEPSAVSPEDEKTQSTGSSRILFFEIGNRFPRAYLWLLMSRVFHLHCTTASAAEEAVTEHLNTKVKAETSASTQVVCSEPLPTNVSEESENSSPPVCDVPDQTQEVVGTKHQHESKTAEETGEFSDSDKQEEEKAADLSQKEDKTEGRVTRKRRLSMQKSSSSKDSAEKEEKDGQEQPSVEETEEDKAPETKTPRRGRSSRTGPEEEEEEPREVERQVETPTRRGRRPATLAQDTSTSTSSVHEKDEKKDEEKEETPLDQNESEDHGVLDAVETSDSGLTRQTGEPSKTDVCEDTQESAEETSEEVQTGDDQQEQEEKQNSPDTGDQSEDLEEGKQEGSSDNKTDVEEDQPRAEQEITPKKPGRRGRPPKAAAAANVDSADKMEDKADESGLNTEEDEDEEEGDNKSRTTRSASRMEAERNKPSKPSTRASRHSGGKEESSSGTARGTRGQAAGAKGARKREASPPVVRTRGGLKPEETPSKRSKR
ncbi:unnamed protein product [Lota lota]